MKFISEFKEFISRGSVMDMAVGIIIGAAFTAIVTSFVSDIVQPFIVLITGGGTGVSGLVIPVAGTPNGIDFGAFISAIINFLIIALVVFLFVKAVNTARSKLERPAEEEAPAAPPEPSNEEKLLAEIRDLLKNK